jgi:hypothetical protein
MASQRTRDSKRILVARGLRAKLAIYYYYLDQVEGA